MISFFTNFTLSFLAAVFNFVQEVEQTTKGKQMFLPTKLSKIPKNLCFKSSAQTKCIRFW